MKILAPWGLWFVVSAGLILDGKLSHQSAVLYVGCAMLAAWAISTGTLIGLVVWLLAWPDEDEAT